MPNYVPNKRSFICYGSQTFEVQERQPLVVGRAGHCDLVLDDEIASREHVRLEIVDGKLHVVDLQSRNGVLLNGTEVIDAQEVHHGDHLTIGQTSLTIVQQEHEPTPSERAPRRYRSSEIDVTETGSLPELLAGSTRIALEAEDITAAEGSCRSLLVSLRGYVVRGLPLDPEWLPDAINLTMELAWESHEPMWLERALELCVSAKIPMTLEQATRLAEISERAFPSRESLDGYIRMADVVDTMGAGSAAVRALRAQGLSQNGASHRGRRGAAFARREEEE